VYSVYVIPQKKGIYKVNLPAVVPVVAGRVLSVESSLVGMSLISKGVTTYLLLLSSVLTKGL